MGYGLPNFEAGQEVQFVAAPAAYALVAAGRALLLDVRDPQGTSAGPGYAEGHPQGAVSLPNGHIMFAPRKVEEVLQGLQQPEHEHKQLICLSNTGEPDGPQAGRCKYVCIYLMAKEGIAQERLARLEGGYKAWKAAGLPISK